MALDFPNTPTIGDEYAPPGVGRSWEWDGIAWKLQADAITLLDDDIAEIIQDPDSATNDALDAVYGVVLRVSDGSDITAALTSAVAAAQITHTNVIIPPGRFTYSGTVTITDRVSISGAGRHQTLLNCAPGFTGPFLIVNECWRGSGDPMGDPGTDLGIGPNKSGVRLRDFALINNTWAPGGGIHTAGRIDDLEISNVEFSGIGGTALFIGGGDTGLVRESRFSNISIRKCGSATAAALDIRSGPNGADGTNQLDFYNLQMLYPHGKGVYIHNANPTVASVRRINFNSMMLHGDDTYSIDDLMVIEGEVQAVDMDHVRTNGSTPGKSCIKIRRDPVNITLRPANIKITADIRNCNTGLSVENISGGIFNLSSKLTGVTTTASFAGVVDPVLLNVVGNNPVLTFDTLLTRSRVLGWWNNTYHRLGTGVGWTLDPYTVTTNMAMAANQVRYQRIINDCGGFYVTALSMNFPTASGNVQFGVYAAVGTGQAAVPGALLASTAIVPCPVDASAMSTIALTTPIYLPEDCFLASWADNGTATIGSHSAALPSGVLKGLCFTQSVQPSGLPATATPLDATRSHFIQANSV